MSLDVAQPIFLFLNPHLDIMKAMSETYLNGKIIVTSLAAPTTADMEKVCALSESERRALLDEALERDRPSGLSDKTVDEIWDSALKKAKAVKAIPDYAL